MNGDLRRTLHQAVLSRLDARKTGMSFSEDVGRWRDRAEEYLQAEMCGLSLGGAEPDALRQWGQWQSSNGPTAFSISNCTAPQRQLP